MNAETKTDNNQQSGTSAAAKKAAKAKKNAKARRRVLCIAIIAVLVLGTVSVGAAYINSYDKIYPGVSVSGIDLGKKTKEEASALLSERYTGAFSENTLTLSCEGETAQLNLDELEASIDIDSTVDAAYRTGRDGGLLKKAGAFLGGNRNRTEMDAVTLLNEETLLSRIDALVQPFEIPKTDYTYELQGNTLTVIKGSGGFEVDRQDAVQRVKHEIDILRFAPVELSPRPVEAEPLDLDTFYDEITADAIDAKYTRIDGKVIADGGKPKIIVEKERIKELLERGEDRASIQVEVIQPNVTKEHLEALMFRDTLGSYSTKYNAGNVERSANVALAASRINGVVLLPGETFSYDKTVLPRTRANGYKEAPVYVGNKVESGLGGGICQTSSTLYSAVLYSNLEIVSRTSHSLPVSYLPAGQDATIAEGYIDFVFRNNTEYPIKISAGAGGGTVSCSIIGTKTSNFKVQLVHQNHSFTEPTLRREYDASLPRGTKKVLQTGAGGYSTSSTRIVTENGVEVKREALSGSRYNPTETIEVVNPEDQNVPSSELAIYNPAVHKAEEEPAKTPEEEENADGSGAPSDTAQTNPTGSTRSDAEPEPEDETEPSDSDAEE